jgi:hypothetical protein
MFHKDRPRTGQQFSIEYDKEGAKHVITGSVLGDKQSGDESYVQLKNVRVNPPFEDYEKVNSILVKFGLGSPSANFFVYDDQNKLKDQFSAKLQYDNATKSWEAKESDRVVQIKDDQKADSADQGKAGSFQYGGKYYTPLSTEPVKIDGKDFIPARLTDQPTQNPVLIDVKKVQA